jgi:hypothetical protein
MHTDFIESNEIIIILGTVLDGKISLREKNRIKKLRKKKIIRLGLGEIEKISTDFAKGKGIDLKFSI